MDVSSTLLTVADSASKRLDDKVCLTLKEALNVFSNALNRLQSLDRDKYRSSATYVEVHGKWGDISRRDAQYLT
jgi:hypothetical protein